jgi:hypothetical protein
LSVWDEILVKDIGPVDVLLPDKLQLPR